MYISAIEAVPFHVLPYTASSSASAARGELAFFRAFVDELPDSLDAIIATADLQGFVGTRELGKAVALEVDRLQRDGELPKRDRTGVVFSGDFH